jgi:cytochrome d ubiquinol oxidase subunit II
LANPRRRRDLCRLLLVSLILRPVGFKFRSKLEGARWRNIWDGALFIGGLVPALVFGVAFGNVLQGVPFRFDDTLRLTYEGTLLGLFNPFALLCGLVSVAMILAHGAAYLACKTEAPLRERAQSIGAIAALVAVILFALGGFWAAHLDGYAITTPWAVDGPSNPLTKEAARRAGGLLLNYGLHPWTMLAPILAIVCGLGTAALMRARSSRRGITFVASALSIAGIIATAGLSLFPFLLPSSLDPVSSLTVWDSSSSLTTLEVMTFATAIFLPVIIAYTSWVYRVLRGPVTTAQIDRDHHTAY